MEEGCVRSGQGEQCPDALHLKRVMSRRSYLSWQLELTALIVCHIFLGGIRVILLSIASLSLQMPSIVSRSVKQIHQIITSLMSRGVVVQQIGQFPSRSTPRHKPHSPQLVPPSTSKEALWCLLSDQDIGSLVIRTLTSEESRKEIHKSQVNRFGTLYLSVLHYNRIYLKTVAWALNMLSLMTTSSREQGNITPAINI